MRRLPPFNHLKAFEAAGRLGSFKAAASEFVVSDSAISQPIRLLEDFLGAPLFIKTYSGVMLTSAGNKYLPSLTEALDSIADASLHSRSSKLSGILRVSVVPSLGSRWLIPRLEQFTLTYPDIIIEPLITPQVVRMNDGVADIAKRHGDGNWAEAEVTLLRDERLVPVASSGLTKLRHVSPGSHL
jgi:LysR family glycine cleavage system transcriptional activator